MKLMKKTLLIGLVLATLGANLFAKPIAAAKKYDKNAYDAAYSAGDWKTCISQLKAKDPKAQDVLACIEIGMMYNLIGEYGESIGYFRVANNLMAQKDAKDDKANEGKYRGTTYEFYLSESINSANALLDSDPDNAIALVRKFFVDNKDEITAALKAQEEAARKEEGEDFTDEINKAVEAMKKANINVDTKALNVLLSGKPAKSTARYEYSPFLYYLATVLFASDEGYDPTAPNDPANMMVTNWKSVDPAKKTGNVNLDSVLKVPAGKGHLEVIALSDKIGHKSEASKTETIFSYPYYDYLKEESKVLNVNSIVTWQVYDEKAQTVTVDNVVIKISDGQSKKAVVVEDFNQALKIDTAAKSRSSYNKSMTRNILRCSGSFVGIVGSYAAAEAAYQQAVQKAGGNPLLLKGAVIAYGKALDALNAGVKALEGKEDADLRQGTLFPAKANAAGFDLAPGTYTVTVEYRLGNSVVETKTISNVVVTEGKSGVVLSEYIPE